MRVYLATPGFEKALADELAPTFAERRTLAPGVVVTSDEAGGAPSGPIDPIFARQVLPDAVEGRGASVRALAENAYAAVESSIDRWPGPFIVHAFPPPIPADEGAPDALPAARLAHTRARAARTSARPTHAPSIEVRETRGLGSRARLVERELLALLAERRKRAARRLARELAPDAFDAQVLLVQLLLVAPDRLLSSAAAPRPLARGGLDLAPWPAGAAPVAVDRTPPSRAYAKLEEAFLWMGAAPRAGETCVDLGAAPGSWTLMAARRGARVIAVDRAPLAPAVAQSPGVTTTAGNAFTYAPPRPVDWLLSDVVCEPPRAIALVEAWLPRARNLVVTIKFKGRAHYGVLAEVAPLFAAARPTFARIKHLAHNKNEVTVMVRNRA